MQVGAGEVLIIILVHTLKVLVELEAVEQAVRAPLLVLLEPQIQVAAVVVVAAAHQVLLAAPAVLAS